MTRPTSVALGLSAAAAALSLTIVNATGTASAAAPSLRTAPRGALRPSVAPALLAPSRASTPTRRAPQKTRVATTASVVRYTVQPGDSFWSIAHKEHVDWYNLAADNGLQMYDVLVAGQVLTVPPAGQATHAAMPLEAPSVTVPQQETTEEPAVQTDSPASAPVTGYSGGSSFEQCVISRESGGNAEVTNGGGYWGLFQFSPSTWAAYGGNPADFGSASAGEQQQVFGNAMAAGGESNWAPYDGC